VRGPEILEKFDRLASGYSQHDYADPARYTRRRAAVATRIGPKLASGALVLDLACGDANMARPLLDLGFRYRGADGSPGMVAEAQARLAGAGEVEVGLIESYAPPEPVDMTLFLRAIPYIEDPTRFFRHVATYTTTKLVFDVCQRELDPKPLLASLETAGWSDIVMRPFFLPQRTALPAPLRLAAEALDYSGPLARVAMRFTGIWFVAARPPRSARE